MLSRPVGLMITLALALLWVLIACVAAIGQQRAPSGRHDCWWGARAPHRPRDRQRCLPGTAPAHRGPRCQRYGRCSARARLPGGRAARHHGSAWTKPSRSSRTSSAAGGSGCSTFRARVWRCRGGLHAPGGRARHTGVRPRGPDCTARWGVGSPGRGRQWVELHYPGRQPSQPLWSRRAHRPPVAMLAIRHADRLRHVAGYGGGGRLWA